MHLFSNNAAIQCSGGKHNGREPKIGILCFLFQKLESPSNLESIHCSQLHCSLPTERSILYFVCRKFVCCQIDLMQTFPKPFPPSHQFAVGVFLKQLFRTSIISSKRATGISDACTIRTRSKHSLYTYYFCKVEQKSNLRILFSFHAIDVGTPNFPENTLAGTLSKTDNLK